MWHEPISEYLAFTFVASCGVLQVTAAYTRRKGMLFFRSPALGYLSGILAVVVAFWWFFAADDRNVRGIEGPGQLSYFTAAVFSAIFFTLFVSSLTGALLPFLKGRSSRVANPRERGLEALKETTYFQAMAYSLRDLDRLKGLTFSQMLAYGYSGLGYLREIALIRALTYSCRWLVNFMRKKK